MTWLKARIVGVLRQDFPRSTYRRSGPAGCGPRDVADAVLDEAVRVEDGDAVTPELDRAALRGDDAGDELGQLGLAVAVDTRDADDLSGVDAERQIGEAAVLALPCYSPHGRAPRRSHGRKRRPFHSVTRSALCQSSCRRACGVGLGAVDRADDLAEAENGDAVGDAEHLAHFMTDEDDGFALADKLLHDGEQALDLDVGQGGGGLVKGSATRPRGRGP